MWRWLALTLFLPWPAVGDEATDAAVELTVRPVLCITDRRNPSCDMSFIVVWRSAETGYYCLFNDFEETSLRCWREEAEGRHTDRRTVEENFSFWMTDDDPASRLARVDVEVLRMDSDDRRRKRRTRHVWDIN